MMIAKRCFCLLVFSCLMLGANMTVKADFWEFFAPYKGPHKDIITLMVTGNYIKPRLLADLVQTQSRQPYLLIPAKNSEKIYFVPARGKALEISRVRIGRFVDFINPRQIMVIGDKNSVSDNFLKLLNERHTVVRAYAKNWDNVAKTIGSMLDLPNLYGDFKDLCREIDKGNLYSPDRSVEADQIKPLTGDDAVTVSDDIGVDINTAVSEPQVLNLEAAQEIETISEDPTIDNSASKTVEESEAFLQIKENFNSEPELVEDK